MAHVEHFTCGQAGPNARSRRRTGPSLNLTVATSRSRAGFCEDVDVPDDHSELPLVLLSHRGPVSFGRDGDRRTATKGSGGLVTALLGLAEHLSDAVWVCAASSDEDIEIAREAEGRSVRVQTRPQLGLVDETDGADGDSDDDQDGKTLEVRMIETDPWEHDAFYTVVSNPILWFIQHGLYGLTFAPVLTANEHTAFTDGYAAVNSRFADAVAEEVEARGGKALVMLQDYHFYLVAGDVRKRCPEALLSHFIHIPWPGPDSWRVLPPYMRDRLLYGLLGSDVVAFHTERYARNFIHCVKELLGLPVDLDEPVRRGGRAHRLRPALPDLGRPGGARVRRGQRRGRRARRDAVRDVPREPGRARTVTTASVS